MIKLHIGISHAAHIPERRAALAGLLAELAPHEVHVTGERAPCWRWSELMWQRAAADEASHCLFLQDDVLVSPRFVERVRALIECHPGALIGLFAPREAAAAAPPGTRALADAGVWGTAYVMPRGALVDFLAWRSALMAARPLRVRCVGEDQLLGAWALDRQRPWLWVLPSLVDRRSPDEMPSCMHEMPDTHSARWDDPAFADLDLESPDGWRGPIAAGPSNATVLPFLRVAPKPGERMLFMRRWGGGYRALSVPPGKAIELESDRPIVMLDGTTVRVARPGETTWAATTYADDVAAWFAIEAVRGGMLAWVEDEHGVTPERPEITWAAEPRSAEAAP